MSAFYSIHSRHRRLKALCFVLLGASCATAPPAELTSARVAYARASTGPAARLVPADVHKAQLDLVEAEKSFADEKVTQKTIDLAYIAQRAAELAEARAEGAEAEKAEAKAKQDLTNKQARIATETKAELAQTRTQLNEAQIGQTQEAQAANADRSARETAEKNATASDLRATAAEAKATEANDALAKLAAKEDERGTVITLSGSVLFRSGEADLLPEAQTRLDQVADALVAKGKNVVVQGYTDSRGSLSKNMNLSQRRAEGVRSYLVSRGFPSEKISAEGKGPDRPVADNTSAEGRANNRRVEIVISRDPSASR
jgi:outer membrane protein OmpA-like peptidoglycan-associated protein